MTSPGGEAAARQERAVRFIQAPLRGTQNAGSGVVDEFCVDAVLGGSITVLEPARAHFAAQRSGPNLTLE